MQKVIYVALFIIFLLPLSLYAQVTITDSTQTPIAKDTSGNTGTGLMSELNNDSNKAPSERVIATFKATRVINGQSIENLAPGVLDFVILHRFGTLNQGASDFFGLDNANTRIGFGYGITRWLMVGIGRSSYEKEYDGFLKAKILWQTTDNRMPISLAYAGTVMTRTNDVPAADTGQKYFFSNRVSYCNQLIIARKFSERFSLQITPSHVHYNLVRLATDPNDVFAIGVGGRIKLTKRFSLNGEWFYTIPNHELYGYRNSVSLGVDIETGGHVFQLHFTNSTGMSERTFIGQTDNSWTQGGIHFGFNISRVFTIVKPKEFR